MVVVLGEAKYLVDGVRFSLFSFYMVLCLFSSSHDSEGFGGIGSLDPLLMASAEAQVLYFPTA